MNYRIQSLVKVLRVSIGIAILLGFAHYGSTEEKVTAHDKFEKSLSNCDRIILFPRSASPVEDILAIVLNNRERYNDLYLLDLKRKRVRLVTLRSNVGYGEWSSDGAVFAFSDCRRENRKGIGVYLYNASSNRVRLISDPKAIAHLPAQSPSNGFVAFLQVPPVPRTLTAIKDFASNPEKAFERWLLIYNLSSRRLRRIATGQFLPRAPVWSSDGKELYVVNKAGELVHLKADGTAQRIITNIGEYSTIHGIITSPTNKEDTLVYSDFQSRLWVIGVQSLRKVQVTDNLAMPNICLIKDPPAILYAKAAKTEMSVLMLVYMDNLDNSLQVSDGNHYDVPGTYLPLSKRVVFVRDKRELWLMNLDGTGKVRVDFSHFAF